MVVKYYFEYDDVCVIDFVFRVGCGDCVVLMEFIKFMQDDVWWLFVYLGGLEIVDDFI